MIQFRCFKGTGIYIFRNYSGLGKTYLFKVLEGYNSLENGKYCLVTYREGWGSKQYIEFIMNRRSDLILCDRFDLYKSTDIVNVLQDLSKESLILLDLKVMRGINSIQGRVNIESRNNEVVVERC